MSWVGGQVQFSNPPWPVRVSVSEFRVPGFGLRTSGVGLPLASGLWPVSAAIFCTGGAECDPKGSMAFWQNQFRCPPVWELEEPQGPKGAVGQARLAGGADVSQRLR